MKKTSLRYVSASSLCIQRVKHGRNFRYLDRQRGPVSDPALLARIRKLALPPAWTEVRICPQANGHLQAVGRDQKGRLQYRYHAEWTSLRNQNKFERLCEFARRLPKMREKLKRHLHKKDFSREKVLAAAVDILQRTNIRVGNEEYTRQNHSYGLTTLRNTHAQVKGSHVRFHFRAKSGKIRDVEFDDPVLSRIVRRCQDLPGQELFCYVDRQGRVHDVKSGDVNRYIEQISGEHFTAKDFRTWCGTLRALELIEEAGKLERKSERDWRRRHLQVIRATAEFLGNTASICEKYYIHPGVFAADRAERLTRLKAPRVPGLNAKEAKALRLLEYAKQRGLSS